MQDAAGLEIAQEIKDKGYKRILSEVDTNGDIIYKEIDNMGYELSTIIL